MQSLPHSECNKPLPTWGSQSADQKSTYKGKYISRGEKYLKKKIKARHHEARL